MLLARCNRLVNIHVKHNKSSIGNNAIGKTGLTAVTCNR